MRLARLIQAQSFLKGGGPNSVVVLLGDADLQGSPGEGCCSSCLSRGILEVTFSLVFGVCMSSSHYVKWTIPVSVMKTCLCASQGWKTA